MANNSEIKITSWNIRGLNNLVKLKQILGKLKQMKSSVVFLQETHLIKDDIGKVTKRWPGQVHYASFTSRARGVMILIHKSIPFQLKGQCIDPSGRYIILNGTILTTQINLINLYAPNEDDPNFYQNLFLTISSYSGNYVIGGDFNCVLNPSYDRSSGIGNAHQQTQRVIEKYMSDLNLTEIWRYLNPNKKEFSCFSSTYKTFSRIDYFLISNNLISKVGKCYYDSIILSDHAPITVSIQINNLSFSAFRFRFQARWLQDLDFVNFMDTKIDQYFQVNTNQTSASVKWEAFKAYIRGEILSYTRHKTKLYYTQVGNLEKQIKAIEQQLFNRYDPLKQKEILILKAQYNELTSSKIVKNLMWLKQSYYDQGEKNGKLLAWRIKKIQTDRTINSIIDENGEDIVDSQEINNVLKAYYENLYKSEYANFSERQNSFLDKLNFPTLSNEDRCKLEGNLSIEELQEALQCMNNGKAPGPDGIPVEIYKKFAVKLMPHLLDVFNESLEKGVLPPSLRSAIITLVLKPGKSPKDKSSYRPISLMSCDTKILCKVLSNRIETLVPNLIMNDQNGFVIGRQAFHNTRRVFNILYKKQNAKDHAVLSLDAEKAFDRIEWGYLFETLKRFGLGDGYLKWIRLLYTEPQAEVITNNQISKPFNLSRGTRQGCPLSPLLFLFAVEPLAMTIRNSPDVKGITVGEKEHCLSLFADDIIVFLSNLKTSIPTLNNILSEFKGFSGYKINKNKSALLILNEDERINSTYNRQFTNTPEGFIYLGIKITPNIKTIIATNYDPLVKKIIDSLERWKALPISIIGRINIIKMSVLPKILYLFQSIPLPPPTSFFSTLNKTFTKFIWNDKRPRLRLSLLYLPYDRGGLRVPNIKLYYWAAQLCTAMYYFKNTDTSPAWVDLENSETTHSLQTYLYSSPIKTLKKYTKNPFLRNTISVWYEAHNFLEEGIKLSGLSPIWGNSVFIPGRNDIGFKNWMLKGISQIKDLYEEGSLMSFQLMVKYYGLPQNHFFKYLQVRSFVYSQMKTYTEPPLSTIENYTLKHLNSRGNLSSFYNLLLEGSKENSLSYLSAWENDLQENISKEEWEEACLFAQTHSINTRCRLLQYKWLFRTYITPVKLNKFNPNIPDCCTKCREEIGTLYHCMWECKEMQKFWKETLCLICQLTEENVPLDPKLCLFHMYPSTLVVNTKKRKLIDFSLLQAKRVIALKWKETQRPFSNQWIKEMSSNLALEKLTYIIKGRLKEFYSIWNSFLHFCNQVNLTGE